MFELYPKLITLDPFSKVRLNPNLYTNGKVCLSILNTWSGPKWSSCQNLSSVLLSIQSLLNENPIHNEPGWENEDGKMCNDYNKVITHENFHIAIINIPNNFVSFLPIIREHFINNYSLIRKKIKILQSQYSDDVTIKSTIYQMKINLNYTNILNKLDNIFISYGGTEIVEDSPVLSDKDKSDISDEIKSIQKKRKGPNKKAKECFAFTPRPLSETINDTIDWITENNV